MSAGPLPEGYRAVALNGIDAFAWAAAEGWLAGALAEGASLHGWAGRRAVESLAGRGPVHVIAAGAKGPGGSSRWAVRHYRRGGAMAPLLGDRYWLTGPSRPLRELEASHHARARGVRTPAVVAGAAYYAGLSRVVGLYRADLVTEVVPQARSLATLLTQGVAPVADALRRAGRLVRALERAGVQHPDLSTGNILLDDVGEAWIVDLDRARTESRPSARTGRMMLARLERSLRKHDRTSRTALPPEAWAALRAGFEEAP